jgi:hypothetical protein
MDEKQEPQKSGDAPVCSVVDLNDCAARDASARKGDWQGYDPTLLTALLDD